MPSLTDSQIFRGAAAERHLLSPQVRTVTKIHLLNLRGRYSSEKVANPRKCLEGELGQVLLLEKL